MVLTRRTLKIRRIIGRRSKTRAGVGKGAGIMPHGVTAEVFHDFSLLSNHATKETQLVINDIHRQDKRQEEMSASDRISFLEVLHRVIKK